MKDVISYAAARHIMVVPEIEMPGHASAILASYPELGCTGGPYAVEGRWGIFDDVLCAGNDDVLKLLPEKQWEKLNEHETVFATGYRRTRNGKQQLELRCDGTAGCLRTPEGGSSKQYLIVKQNGEVHARLLTVREAARLMGAPDSFILPGSYNDGYKAMGDAVAMPVAKFIGERFLTKIAEAVYNDQR